MTIALLAISAMIFAAGLALSIRNRTHGYLAVMFFTYHLNYFAIPAIFHVNNNSFPFYNLPYPQELQLQGALLVLAFAIFSFIGLCAADLRGRTVWKTGNTSIQRTVFTADRQRLYLALLLALTYQIVVIYLIGFDNLLARRSEFDREAFGSNATQRELFLLSSRAISIACIFFSILYWRQFSSRFFAIANFSIFACLFLIINYPLALPRFVLGSYLIVFIIFFWKATTRRKSIFYMVFGLGVTTIFPFLSHLGRGEGNFSLNMLKYYSESGDFDGFQSVLNVVEFVTKEGYQFGYQTIGAILAWVPRGFWPSKPSPTGSIVAENYGYEFLNISSPISAELFIDFGYFGVTIFALAFGQLIAYLDSQPKRQTANTKNSLERQLFIAIFGSFLMILLRGPLIGAANVFYVEVGIFIAFSLFVGKRTSLTKKGGLIE